MTAALAAALLLTSACGEDPAAEPEGSPDEQASETLDSPRLAQIIAIAGVGGDVSPRPVYLDDQAALEKFTQGFSEPDTVARQLAEPMQQADDEGVRLAAALVSVDCEVPPGVEITESNRGLMVVAEPIPDTGKECLVPLSSVALVAVPE